MTTEHLARAIDRAVCLITEPVLNQPPENIMVNAPVAIHQIAFQNELNGILLGLGLADEKVLKLPLLKDKKKSIIKALEKIAL